MNALLTYFAASDARLSGRASAWRPPRWFRVWMVASTRMADGWVCVAVVAALALAGGRGWSVLGALALALALSNALLVAIKRRVPRLRPCEHAAHAWFGGHPLSWFTSDRFSFPSGHTLNAFTIATVLLLAFPVSTVPVLVFAGSAGLSRVVLGMHFVSDVLCGALLGTAIGIAAYTLVLG